MTKYCILSLFFLAKLAQAIPSDTIRLSKMNSFPLFLPSYVSVLEDRNRTISFQKIQSDTSLVFEKTSVEGHLGTNGSAHWVRFVIDNDTPTKSNLLIEIQNLHINWVDFYLTEAIGNTKIIKTQKTGDMLPFIDRPLPTRTFVFEADLEAGKCYTFYFYLDNSFEPMSVPMYVHSPASFAKNESLFVAVFFVFTGILLAMSLISMYLFTTYKQPIFLYYSLFSLSDLMWALCNYGFAYQWFWPESPTMQNKLLMIFPLLSFIFFMQFLKYFFKPTNENVLNHLLLKISTWVGCLLLIIFPIYFTTASTYMEATFLNVLWIFFLSMFVMFSYIIIQSYVRNPTKAHLLFTIGFLIMLQGAIINVIRELYALPTNIWVEHGCMVGLFVEVLFTCYALTLNINTLLKNREQLLIESSNYQKELLKTAINAEDGERKRIAEDLHDDLGILLTSGKMEAAKSENQDKVIDLIDQSVVRMQKITQKLHPSVVGQFGLIPSLEDFLESLALTVPFKLEFRLTPNINISAENEVNLFRIATELLNNAVKHSKAKFVFFELKLENIEGITQIVINITDDGIGLGNRTGRGLGLSNIESRVQNMKGKIQFDLESKGLKVNIYIPLNQ